MSRPVLAAQGLVLGYGGRPLLADVDLEVRAGEFWFLIGPNGAGKTTFLRAVLGLVTPLGGTLQRDPAAATPRRLGFVPQRSAMARTLPTTAREFVSLGLVASAVTRREHGDALAWALHEVGLSALADRDFWSLSGGQRQRALLARALVRRPQLMLLDEPTEGLDVPAESAFLATLSKLHQREGLTLLFVTHRLDIAARLATHVALFHEGRVLAGPRDRVLSGEAVVRAFGPSAPEVSRAAVVRPAARGERS